MKAETQVMCDECGQEGVRHGDVPAPGWLELKMASTGTNGIVCHVDFCSTLCALHFLGHRATRMGIKWCKCLEDDNV